MRYLVLTTCLVFVSFNGYTADAEPSGKQLHDNNCVSCHQSEVYTRKSRFVTTYTGLQTQVERCASNLDLSWFPDQESKAVTDYLNGQYYQFGKK